MPYLGVEIGGTKLQIGVGEGDGKLLSLWRGVAQPEKGAAGIRGQIAAGWMQLQEQLDEQAKLVRGVGIAFGGPVDLAKQTAIHSHQVDGWDNFDLRTWASELFGVPAYAANDADAAGLAEACFGAGKGFSPVFYVTVASGLGGALVIDGEIYEGVGLGAAEIGHLQITRVIEGRIVMKTLENWASGWAIQQSVRRQLQNGAKSSLCSMAADIRQITTKEVAQAARQGDELARQALSVAVDALAEALCQVIALLCPRRIVIGGGVSLIGEEFFFAPLREHVAQRVFKPFAGITEIVPAALGEQVAVHGVIALARDAFR